MAAIMLNSSGSLPDYNKGLGELLHWHQREQRELFGLASAVASIIQTQLRALNFMSPHTFADPSFSPR